MSDGNQLIDQIVRAKTRGVPFVAISTSDPRKLAQRITERLSNEVFNINEQPTPTTAIHWDVANGLHAILSKCECDIRGKEWLNKELPESEFADQTHKPLQALLFLQQLPPQSIVFIHQTDRWFSNEPENAPQIQAAANLRDAYHSNKRMIVFLAPSITMPPELAADVMVLDDPLPTAEQIATLFQRHKILGQLEPKPEEQLKVATLVSGLSEFGAQQAIYMSVKRDGNKTYIDRDELRGLRRRNIEQCRGLSIVSSQYKFDDVAGMGYIKNFLHRVMKGKRTPGLIVNVEEINWAMSGVRGDNTGVSQDQLSVMLDHMERNGDTGVIFFGAPGCSKSYIAQVLGNEYEVDTVLFDLNGMKQSEVGSSEQHIRQALKVLKGLSGGRKLWIATCNEYASLDAALLRRFDYGVFYFDLPDANEKSSIWDVQMRLNQIPKKNASGLKNINTTDWSAADIRNCCRRASDWECTIAEASTHVNPAARQNPMVLKRLRYAAHGKLVNAATGKIYQYEKIDELEKQFAASGSLATPDIDI